MSLIDDATGTVHSHFEAQETTWAAAGLLRAWVEQYGVPRSPEAKGRIERNHGTNQDRLIKQMRRTGIASIEAANAYLGATYLPQHNARFAVAPVVAADAHLPVPRGQRLDAVFCLETVRQWGSDWVVRYQNQGLQVTPARAAQRHAAPGRRVVVRESATGTLTVVVRSPAGGEHTLAWTPVAITRGGRPFTPPPVPPQPGDMSTDLTQGTLLLTLDNTTASHWRSFCPCGMFDAR